MVDLDRFRGRRIRVRFLVATFKVTGTLHVEQAFNFSPDPGDDGWFIDDVTVTGALADPPATIQVDTDDVRHLPTCDARSCGESGGVQAAVELSRPSGSALPGQSVDLDASGSTVDVCKQGALQYRYWIEVDGTAAFNPPADRLLRDWTFSTRARDTPQGATRYGVQVRCSTDPGCLDTRVVTAAVDCPSSGDLTSSSHEHPFLHRTPPERRTVFLDATQAGDDKQVRVLWTTEATIDVLRGDLASLRLDGAFGASEVCAVDNLTQGTEWTDDTPTPEAGDALFWLLRSAEACNVPTAGGSFGGVSEAADRDTQACPD